jgi:hypothetical protein
LLAAFFWLASREKPLEGVGILQVRLGPVASRSARKSAYRSFSRTAGVVRSALRAFRPFNTPLGAQVGLAAFSEPLEWFGLP